MYLLYCSIGRLVTVIEPTRYGRFTTFLARSLTCI